MPSLCATCLHDIASAVMQARNTDAERRRNIGAAAAEEAQRA